MLQVNHLHKERKVSKEQSKEDIKNPSLHLKEERHLQYGHQIKGMKMFFMVTITHVMNARRYNEIFYNTLRCWICDQVVDIDAHCHTMRCYNCSGFGHKSQDCWNTRRKSMMMNSYSMTRRRNEFRKEDIFENMEAHSSSSEKLGNLQKWVKKTEQLEQNDSLKGSSSLSSSKAYTSYNGNNRVHTQADL
jgi:hypothetical protein